jgi:hypothetical protein
VAFDGKQVLNPNPMSLQHAVITAEQNGGVSYNLHHGHMNPDTGYMVSLAGRERVSDTLTYHNVLGYVNDNLEAFETTTYLGLWKEGDVWFMDVSVCIPNLATALRVAEVNGQRAVYDNANKKSIYLNPNRMEELIKTIKEHDFWYMMSDDPRVFGRGQAVQESIENALKNYPKEEVLNNLPEPLHKFIESIYGT